MPQGDKSAYTSKQKRQAEHIEDAAKKRGKSAKTAARIAWATVNKQNHGGKKSGSGRGRKRQTTSAAKGGRNSHKGSSYTETGARKKTRKPARKPARKRTRSRAKKS